MSKYLNHIEYNRWCRSYIMTFNRFLEYLEALRISLDDIPGKGPIEKDLDKLDEQLEDAIPRNFNNGADPLKTSEVFIENIKVLINFFYRSLQKEEPFESIYQAEKHRVLHQHQEFHFKERYAELKHKADYLITAYHAQEREAIIEKLKKEKEKKAIEEENTLKT